VLQDYFDDGSGKGPRDYQVSAVNAAIEVIAKGRTTHSVLATRGSPLNRVRPLAALLARAAMELPRELAIAVWRSHFANRRGDLAEAGEAWADLQHFARYSVSVLIMSKKQARFIQHASAERS
jgi:hypothetical protein